MEICLCRHVSCSNESNKINCFLPTKIDLLQQLVEVHLVLGELCVIGTKMRDVKKIEKENEIPISSFVDVMLYSATVDHARCYVAG